MGWELFHLVGKKIKDEGGKVKGDEYSIIWMVPALHGGHIILAEMKVQLVKEGRDKGKVASEVVRFMGDWTDWTAVQTDDYAKEEDGEVVTLDLGGEPGTGKAIMDRLTQPTQELLPQGCKVVPKELDRRVTRTIEEVAREGNVMERFEVEKVFRQSTSRKRSVVPAVRIALRCQGKEEPGAVILLDTSGVEGKRRVKHIAVMYAGEWPVRHHYKEDDGGPSLDELDEYIGRQPVAYNDE